MARVTYYVVVEHNGLKKWREIKGSDKYVVEQKARLQQAQWDDQWQQKCLKEKQQQRKTSLAKTEQNRKQALLAEKERGKERQRQELEDIRQSAEDRTLEAKQAIDAVHGILHHTLTINDAIDWELLKSRIPFGKQKPSIIHIDKRPPDGLPRKPELQQDPKPEPKSEPKSEPSRKSFQPKRTLVSKLIKSVREKQDRESETAYAAALEQYSNETRAELAKWQAKQERQQITLERWQAQCAEIESRNAAALADYEQRKASAERDLEKKIQAWEQAKYQYESQQAEENAKIDARRNAYLRKESDAILDYCEMVLSASQYPDNFPQNFDLEYQDDTGMLVVNYALPALEHMPTLAEVKFVQSSRSFKELSLSEKAISAMYDEAIYQIILRTLHELFEADVADTLAAIVLNGLVTAVDKTTGNNTTTCILSIQVKKEEFLKINLANVDPKACFKALKGVGSSKLHGMTAVAPILNISREDSRFVDSYDVADSLDSSVNLAAMDWEDFEHLIREVFAKEFSANGGEVKVTQASRDGGVDAIAFDPDPIRGGKIVIQAKRYTNTVGVSAVRDLFGTVTHEGATKGILVTTANYGPDAYEFIAGKPLTLLNGANLLHLLEKHGHQARIDLREAKQMR